MPTSIRTFGLWPAKSITRASARAIRSRNVAPPGQTEDSPAPDEEKELRFTGFTGEALYLGGNFKNILEKSTLDGGKGIPRPGFAMFPSG